ncbi:MAG: acetylornithine carbamoyltransferase [Bacteroidetes bacterium]|nr:acetylornithine carbamoyltransferase [Bacteroidota bacterium]MDA1120039.1 acetylornithine carbamoyltransferase [Bacteroidota bacterium]
MKQFTSVDDISDPLGLVEEALSLKKSPLAFNHLGKDLTLGLIFMNPSLRTRLSTQKAAQNLGMNVMVMNVGSDGWHLETEDGVIMNSDKAEHVKEAAAVIGQYCNIIGLRSFPGLTDREKDYKDVIINSFVKYSGVPVISLESAIYHPLQSLADLMTIEELKAKAGPKVVLSWAPHIKALPQSVPNSFAKWINTTSYEFVITHPEGYELAEDIAGDAQIEYDQNKAFEGADFIYTKNWSSYREYGKILSSDKSWMVDELKMSLTNNGKFMNCLPVRRNLIVSDGVLDGQHSVVIQQAGNREFSAQAVLKRMIEGL